MKNIKRIIAVLISLLMVTVSSYAAGISFENAAVTGSNVSIDVMLDAIPSDIEDVSAVTIKYDYDKTKLEYVSTVSDVYTNVVATDGNIIWFDSASGTDATQKITDEKLAEVDNILFTIHFIKAERALGEVEVEITFVELADSSLTVSDEATAESGIINLGEAPEGEGSGSGSDSGSEGEGSGSGSGSGSEGEGSGSGSGSGSEVEGSGSGGSSSGGSSSDGSSSGGSSSGGSSSGGSSSGGSSSGGSSSGDSSSGSSSSGGSSSGGSSSGGSSSGGSIGGSTSAKDETTGKEQENKPAENKENKFADLDKENWAYAYANSLFNKGIISGDGAEIPSVRPGANITREEAAIMALLAMGIKPEQGLTLDFKDADGVSSWAVPYVATAVKHGILAGSDGYVNAKKLITREEMVSILARAFKWQTSDGDLTFEDSNDVASWSRASVVYAVKAGVMMGSNNQIRPKATITRAETFVLIDKCMNLK